MLRLGLVHILIQMKSVFWGAVHSSTFLRTAPLFGKNLWATVWVLGRGGSLWSYWLADKQADVRVIEPQCSHLAMPGVEPLPCEWGMGGGRGPLTSQPHSPGILPVQLGVGGVTNSDSKPIPARPYVPWLESEGKGNLIFLITPTQVEPLLDRTGGDGVGSGKEEVGYGLSAMDSCCSYWVF